MRESAEREEKSRDAIGVIPTRFSTHGPKTIPRIDYERIFVLDSATNLLGEYALDDDCPLESSDLKRSMPISGLRHLVSFYQGEYAYTPFKVDDLWFVVLTRGIPRIEERGSVGTLLAAARIHIPPMLDPAFTKREADLRAREAELTRREEDLTRREAREDSVEAELRVASTHLNEMEMDLRAREAKLATLRDYALKLQRTFIPEKQEPADGSAPAVAPEPR